MNMDVSSSVTIQESDIVAFPHPNRDSQKPEIVKAAYILEILYDILESCEIEPLINERLINKEIGYQLKPEEPC